MTAQEPFWVSGARDPVQAARARQQLAPDPPAGLLDRVRRAVCDVARLRILQALAAGPLSVDDLALVIERSPTATSQHLRVLRELGLVAGTRRGTAIYYRLRPGPETAHIQAVVHQLVQGARDAPAQQARGMRSSEG